MKKTYMNYETPCIQTVSVYTEGGILAGSVQISATIDELDGEQEYNW
jgi:hypothetical protein